MIATGVGFGWAGDLPGAQALCGSAGGNITGNIIQRLNSPSEGR